LNPLREDRQRSWDAASKEMSGCLRCHLSRSRNHVVIYRGSPTPKLLFLGEAPGAEEDRLGVPFVGRAGKTLSAAIARLGLTEDEYGITNVIMCRPEANVFDRKAATACTDWLRLKLHLLDPRFVVTLGDNALHALLPEVGRVTEVAGSLLSWEQRPLVPLLHPAATFRRKAYAERWQSDLSRLADWLGKSGRPWSS
jgi:DNA polymerase